MHFTLWLFELVLEYADFYTFDVHFFFFFLIFSFYFLFRFLVKLFSVEVYLRDWAIWDIQNTCSVYSTECIRPLAFSQTHIFMRTRFWIPLMLEKEAMKNVFCLSQCMVLILSLIYLEEEKSSLTIAVEIWWRYLQWWKFWGTCTKVCHIEASFLYSYKIFQHLCIACFYLTLDIALWEARYTIHLICVFCYYYCVSSVPLILILFSHFRLHCFMSSYYFLLNIIEEKEECQ